MALENDQNQWSHNIHILTIRVCVCPLTDNKILYLFDNMGSITKATTLRIFSFGYKVSTWTQKKNSKILEMSVSQETNLPSNSAYPFSKHVLDVFNALTYTAEQETKLLPYLVCCRLVQS